MTVVFVAQNDGGKLSWLNCNCAVTAMQIAFETNGAVHPTGSEVRSRVRNADGSLDVTGGTRPSQVVAAAKTFGVTLDAMTMSFEGAWTLGQRDDYAIGFSIRYAPVSGTRFDGSPGFTGNHQVLLSGGKVFDPLADGRRAGIPKGPQAWPKALLQRAAGALNTSADGYTALGEGRATVIIARVPAIKPTRYAVRFTPGSFFAYTVIAGRTTGRATKRFRKATSAPYTAPDLVVSRAGAAARRLVQVTHGAIAGLWVEPGSSHVRVEAVTE